MDFQIINIKKFLYTT